MKILIYSDNHFCQYSSILRSRGVKYSKRLENGIESINFVEEEATRFNCDQVVCCGDFFDKPTLNAEELSALNEIKWANLPHIFLVGNHEMASNDLEFNSVNALSRLGFSVITQPSVQMAGNTQLCYLPYQLDCTGKKINDYFSSYERRVVFSHNDIAGIQMGKFISTSGLNIDDIEDSCDYFFNGHLHNSSWIRPGILNIGNLTGMNFSEDGFTYLHMYAVIDTDTLKVEVLYNPYAIYFMHVDDSNFEKFKEFKNTGKDILKYFVVSIKTTEDKIKEVRKFTESLNLLASKITCISSSKEVENQLTFERIDHINQFVNYFLDKYGDTELARDELSRTVL